MRADDIYYGTVPPIDVIYDGTAPPMRTDVICDGMAPPMCTDGIYYGQRLQYVRTASPIRLQFEHFWDGQRAALRGIILCVSRVR